MMCVKLCKARELLDVDLCKTFILKKKKSVLTPRCYRSHWSTVWRENKQADICATWRGCGKVDAHQVPAQQGRLFRWLVQKEAQGKEMPRRCRSEEESCNQLRNI